MNEKLARQMKNEQYRTNLINFMIEHSGKKCNGNFSTTTKPNGNKLIAIITCDTCKQSKTFYYNIL